MPCTTAPRKQCIPAGSLARLIEERGREEQLYSPVRDHVRVRWPSINLA
jgi:hypothetical protein